MRDWKLSKVWLMRIGNALNPTVLGAPLETIRPLIAVQKPAYRQLAVQRLGQPRCPIPLSLAIRERYLWTATSLTPFHANSANL